MPTTDPPAETGPDRRPDAATPLTAAVAALALAGVCALLAAHLLHGGARLAAGMLAGIGAGLALAALLGRLAPRAPALARGGAAALLALLLAGALTVPALLASRPEDLSDGALARLAPLAEGDAVVVAEDPDAPVLLRRADGPAQLLDPVTGSVGTLEAGAEERVLLAADGTRVLVVGARGTRVLDARSPHGPLPQLLELPGEPLALAGDRLVVQAPHPEGCATSGHDLAAPAPAEASWTLLDRTAGGCAATRALAEDPGPQAVLPAVPVRTDPRQGIVQMDPATGFPVGELLARTEEGCRAHVTAPPPADPGERPGTGELVVLVCPGGDGALTARAFRDGAPLWTSEPSPAGDWQVRVDAGRVIATGTEAGTGAIGEIVASEARAAWTAPGGPTPEGAFRARLGIDGAQMVGVNSGAQTIALDTATGRQRWSLPASAPDAPVQGVAAHGTAVVLDPAPRRAPLDPRGAQRLRVVDASGEVTVQRVLREAPRDVLPLPGGRALLGTAEGLHLVGGA